MWTLLKEWQKGKHAFGDKTKQKEGKTCNVSTTMQP